MIQGRADVYHEQEQQQCPAQAVESAEREPTALPETAFKAARSITPPRELSQLRRLTGLRPGRWRHLAWLRTAGGRYLPGS